MDFLIHSRAVPDLADAGDPALDEAHWSYMDAFAAGMVARGPTLGRDRERWTGSIHIVDLPDAAAARAFAEREPYNARGRYAEHRIRRFENRLGRTMWEAPPSGSTDPRFFVFAPDGVAVPPPERLIVCGRLSTPDEDEPAGFALALQAPSRADVERLLGAGAEILDWELGGRR